MALIGNPQMLLLDEPTSGVSMDEKTALMVLAEERVRDLVTGHRPTHKKGNGAS